MGPKGGKEKRKRKKIIIHCRLKVESVAKYHADEQGTTKAPCNRADETTPRWHRKAVRNHAVLASSPGPLQALIHEELRRVAKIVSRSTIWRNLLECAQIFCIQRTL